MVVVLKKYTFWVKSTSRTMIALLKVLGDSFGKYVDGCRSVWVMTRRMNELRMCIRNEVANAILGKQRWGETAYLNIRGGISYHIDFESTAQERVVLRPGTKCHYR